ncbi:hypothetical protein ACFW9O_06280 [Streptomyces sp. NPDC059499]|uniref:hypothetical protein n=1 Tax=Streptomyces sp. NPDC059499 TaxID=3346852 RepID=UPI003680C7E8
MSGPEHRHDDDRTGNGIVNHGPEKTPNTEPEHSGQGTQGKNVVAGEGVEASGGTGTKDGADASDAADTTPRPGRDATSDGAGATDGAGTSDGASTSDGAEKADAADAGASGGGGTLTELFGSGRGGSDLDEVALRSMLHGAVRSLEPPDGVLAHLHKAVPARRAKRRQAVVGAAAAALLIGTAVPAFVHVANSDGSNSANTAIAGHGEQTQGGNGDDSGAGSDSDQNADPADQQIEGSDGESGNSTAPSQDEGSDTAGSGTGIDDLPHSDAAALPACEPSQLQVVSAQSGEADADGKVYGTFRIANASDEGCSVTSNGTVGFQAAGAADPQKIAVVQHAANDPAAGLPDPSLEPGTVLLKPMMAYEVQFAWVPTESCPSTGGSPSPTPTEGDGGGGAAGAGTTADMAAQFGSADDGPADGSVAVTHTPEVGAPTAETTISNACAGTIYRTGVLNAS